MLTLWSICSAPTSRVVIKLWKWALGTDLVYQMNLCRELSTLVWTWNYYVSNRETLRNISECEMSRFIKIEWVSVENGRGYAICSPKGGGGYATLVVKCFFPFFPCLNHQNRPKIGERETNAIWNPFSTLVGAYKVQLHLIHLMNSQRSMLVSANIEWPCVVCCL